MTTTDLVPVFSGTLAGQATSLCNARDLHAVLGVGRDFSNWIKERIAEYGFVEGDDFLIDSPKRANQSGRGGDRRSRDYHLTLDMAKELAMIENNDKGRQVRRYFIACEKKSRQAAPTLQVPVSDLDRQKRSRINRRALELSHRAYETYRDQMLRDHLIANGMRTIEEWLPPKLASDIAGAAETIAALCDLHSKMIRQAAAGIDSMTGIEKAPGN